jgi:hypothetical protein
MGWLSVIVPRSPIEDGFSLRAETSASVFELAGVGKISGDSMKISEGIHLGQIRYVFDF